MFRSLHFPFKVFWICDLESPYQHQFEKLGLENRDGDSEFASYGQESNRKLSTNDRVIKMVQEWNEIKEVCLNLLKPMNF